MAPKHHRRPRGTGTIQRQRDGSYIARTTDKSRSGRFPAGPAGFKQAEEALELWNAQRGVGVNPNESRQKLRDFIRLWLTDVVKTNLRPRTYEFYLRHAGYATAILGDVPIEAISTQAIERMLSRLQSEGLSARSVDHVRAVLHNAFTVAKRWYKIPNPVDEVPHRRVNERQEKALTVEQVARLLAAVEGDRLCALYHVALTLGLRRGELLGLAWANIDFEAGTLSVTQQVTEGVGRRIELSPLVKTDEGHRTLPLPPDLAERLRQRQQEDRDEGRTMQQRAARRAEKAGLPVPLVQWNPLGLVFCSEAGTMIQPANFNRRFAKVVARAGLPKTVTPHTLRHTALTDLAAHGEAKAVQSIAGHADIDTTMRVYAGRRMTAMRDAVEKLEQGRRKTG